MLVVTGAGEPDRSAVPRSGSVRFSADGRSWQEAVAGGSALLGVAASDGLAVAVGVDGAGHGTVLTSRNGRRWSDPVTVPDPLVDVAHGPDGTWLAVGRARDVDDFGGAVVVYRSSDGKAWEQVNRHEAVAGRYDHRPLAVAHGGGRWLMLVHDCAGASLCGVHLVSSIDRGVSWTEMPTDDHPEGRDASVPNGLIGLARPAGLAHDGHRFAALGVREVRPGSNAAPAAVGGVSTDGVAWERLSGAVDGAVPTALTWSGDAWLAVDGPPAAAAASADTGTATPGVAGRGVWSSADLRSWTRLAALDAPVRDIAVLDPARGATKAPAPAGSLQVRPQALELLAEDRTVRDTFRYDAGPARAIAALTALLGEPTGSTFQPGDQICTPDRTEVRWDGITLVVPGRDPAAATSFGVRQEVSRATEQDPARLRTVQGIALGSTREQVGTLAPGSPGARSDDREVVLTESPDGEQGVLVQLTARRVTGIAAPEPLVDTC
ncbi:hypothetical protein [Kitasatospora sp. NPDC088346]|uniref:hypothetical protein n=1 Tax=Kitasatospora sp. NPDC088346 TaxID=3364073 RepID=UPI0038094F9E